MEYWKKMEEIRQGIREEKQESSTNKDKSVHEKLIKEKPKLDEDDKLYSFEELKDSLLNYRGLKEVVTGFKPTEKELDSDALLIATVTTSKSKKTGIPEGHYVGVPKERVIDNQTMYSLNKGRAPKKFLESTWVLKPLVRILPDDFKYTYNQPELLDDLNNGISVEDIRDESVEGDYIISSAEKVNYLTILRKKDINAMIEECLVRYNELINPDVYLERYTHMRNKLKSDSSMIIYAPLLDKEIITLN